ncbi:hypothetical protein ACJQWK_07577 [Exserohilum turcicum]
MAIVAIAVMTGIGVVAAVLLPWGTAPPVPQGAKHRRAEGGGLVLGIMMQALHPPRHDTRRALTRMLTRSHSRCAARKPPPGVAASVVVVKETHHQPCPCLGVSHSHLAVHIHAPPLARYHLLLCFYGQAPTPAFL